MGFSVGESSSPLKNDLRSGSGHHSQFTLVSARVGVVLAEKALRLGRCRGCDLGRSIQAKKGPNDT